MLRLLLLSSALVLPAWATGAFASDDEFGTLNPQEMGFESIMEKVDRGEVGMVVCASGYHITKAGRHGPARKLFERCAEAGYTGTMTWMSQMEDNGFGGPENPDAAAEWDRRAAEAGDPIGKFNYGLDLIRGRGVGQDPVLGRQLIDEAAAAGVDSAIRLQKADYDLDEVTPDADNWKYAPLF